MRTFSIVYKNVGCRIACHNSIWHSAEQRFDKVLKWSFVAVSMLITDRTVSSLLIFCLILPNKQPVRIVEQCFQQPGWIPSFISLGANLSTIEGKNQAMASTPLIQCARNRPPVKHVKHATIKLQKKLFKICSEMVSSPSQRLPASLATQFAFRLVFWMLMFVTVDMLD